MNIREKRLKGYKARRKRFFANKYNNYNIGLDPYDNTNSTTIGLFAEEFFRTVRNNVRYGYK